MPALGFQVSGSFSHVNDFLLAELQRPRGVHVHQVDVGSYLPRPRVRQCLEALSQLPGVRSWPSLNSALAFTPTAWIARSSKARVLRGVDAVLQTQSLFDGRLPGIPHFVYTDHTFRLLAESGRRVPGRRLLAMERELYAGSEVVFTFSEHVAQSIARDYDLPGKAVCAFTGIAVQPGRPPEDKDYAPQRILFVGADWERKGGPELIEAFRQVRATHHDAELVVAGCSPDLDVPGVEVVGQIEPHDLSRYYEWATVFCMPSRAEPSGIVFSEAAAFGLAVVATTTGGVPERVIHGETGFLVSPRAPDEVAGALQALLEDENLRRDMGRSAQQRCEATYSWARTASIIQERMAPFLS